MCRTMPPQRCCACTAWTGDDKLKWGAVINGASFVKVHTFLLQKPLNSVIIICYR